MPQNDLVWPFGDRWQALVTAITFDLNVDILYCSDEYRNLQIPLARVREQGPLELDQFTIFEPPSPPELNTLAFQSPSWTPSFSVPSRSLSFVTCITTDFNFQWRHILRRPYIDSTFRKLAKGILIIGNPDFQTTEETSRWKRQTMGPASYIELYNVQS